MNKGRTTYDKIEDVLRAANKPIAAHEFVNVWMRDSQVVGREYIGQSESTIARRLREMAVTGRVIAKTREGKNFREYTLPQAAPVAQPECPV